MALKHKDNHDPKEGLQVCDSVRVHSMHNFLLRYYLAEAGLNPDTDVQQLRVVPAEMVANLRAGNIDGFGPDPFNQRAVYEEVGFIHVLTRTCGTATPAALAPAPSSSRRTRTPLRRLYRSVLTAAAMARDRKTAS
jgi:nitrate/nitrite transport system substrate-binding protein